MVYLRDFNKGCSLAEHGDMPLLQLIAAGVRPLAHLSEATDQKNNEGVSAACTRAGHGCSPTQPLSGQITAGNHQASWWVAQQQAV